MLLVNLRKNRLAGIGTRQEIIIVGLGRIERRANGFEAGVVNRRRGQAVIAISIIGRIDLRIG